MFNSDKKNESMQEPPMGLKLMLAMSVQTGMEFQKLVSDLISKYKANNIDVIPIKELEECMHKSIDKSLSPDGIMASIMKGE